MKKVGIYNPYMHILGGAERYVLSIAQCLGKDFEIILYADDANLPKKARKKFGLKLDNISVKPWPGERRQRNKYLRTLDMFFYVTDGSIFISPAQKNVLIVQTPKHVPKRTIKNRLKLIKWHKVICYSQFMADIIKERLRINAVPLFVPLTTSVKAKLSPKDDLILSVGRFFSHLHNKKQKEMVNIFKQMVLGGLWSTKLCLVGSVDPGAGSYYKEVVSQTEGFPIEVIVDPPFRQLENLYRRAKIYWHAAGFGEDLEAHPERAEHFGVVTLEAMASGAVPVVFAGGGQTELVTNGFDGFTWKNIVELKKYTRALLTNETMYKRLASRAMTTAEKYTMTKFCENLHDALQIK